MLKLEYYDIINEMQQLLSELKKNHKQNYQNVNTRGKVEKIAYILGGVNEHLTAISFLHTHFKFRSAILQCFAFLSTNQYSASSVLKNQNITIFPLFKNYCSL